MSLNGMTRIMGQMDWSPYKDRILLGNIGAGEVEGADAFILIRWVAGGLAGSPAGRLSTSCIVLELSIHSMPHTHAPFPPRPIEVHKTLSDILLYHSWKVGAALGQLGCMKAGWLGGPQHPAACYLLLPPQSLLPATCCLRMPACCLSPACCCLPNHSRCPGGAEMTEAAGAAGKPMVLINPKLGDIQSGGWEGRQAGGWASGMCVWVGGCARVEQALSMLLVSVPLWSASCSLAADMNKAGIVSSVLACTPTPKCPQPSSHPTCSGRRGQHPGPAGPAGLYRQLHPCIPLPPAVQRGKHVPHHGGPALQLRRGLGGAWRWSEGEMGGAALHWAPSD